jgi:lipoprotein-releasing system permease protein
MRYESFVALRHLKSSGRSYISPIAVFCIVGIVLGVATLTSVISVTGGFQEKFREIVLGVNSHILVMKYGLNFREYPETIKTVERVPGVQAAAPFVFHEMMVHHEGRSALVLVKGIDVARAGDVSDLPKYVIDGDLTALSWTRQTEPDPASESDEDQRTPGIMLGVEVAQRLRAKVGSTLELVSPLRGLDPDSWAPTQMAPSHRRFLVVGIYRCGFHEYDNKLVIVDYRSIQDFFHQGDVVTGLEVRVDDVFNTAAISRTIKSKLPPGRFRTLDWREINRNLFTSLKLQKLVLAIILTFIVIVACFNIVSTLIMLVLEKQKEIAILKSMGATDGGILRIFMLEGMVIGGTGTAIGLIVGFVACLAISTIDIGMDASVYLIDRLPVKMQIWEFTAVALVSLAICFAATLYPSWRAARTTPVDGLRFD